MPARTASAVGNLSVRQMLALTLACLFCAAPAFWLAGCSKAGTPDEEFRIGLLADISENPVKFTAHLTAQKLVDRLNAQGGLLVGGRRLKVRLFVEDTGGQVERTMAAAGRLIQQERVAALVGPYLSREAVPVAAAAEAAHVPLLSPTASSPVVTQGRAFVFRVCMVDTAQGLALARFAFGDLGLRRAAMLYDEADVYSSGLAGYFAAAFTALGGQIVAQETYATGAEDVSAQLARIRSASAQALLLPNQGPQLPGQAAQARAAGFSGVLLGGDTWDVERRLHALPQAQGAFFSADFAPEGMDQGRRQEAEELAAEAGALLNKATAMTLDGLGLLFAAAQAAGSVDPVSLRAGLVSLRGFEGLTGRISSFAGGDPQRNVNILGISGGRASLRRVMPPAQ